MLAVCRRLVNEDRPKCHASTPERHLTWLVRSHVGRSRGRSTGAHSLAFPELCGRFRNPFFQKDITRTARRFPARGEAIKIMGLRSAVTDAWVLAGCDTFLLDCMEALTCLWPSDAPGNSRRPSAKRAL